MEDPSESAKRLEMSVKRLSSVRVEEEQNPRTFSKADVNNLASPEVAYVGSMVDQEGAFPTGMRHRGIEAPIGSKLGYHELEDEKEEADSDWMLGEASMLSGAGTRGSSNWVLKIMVPILLIVGVIVMHQWWTDIKRSASNTIDAVGDAFDRRALEAIKADEGGVREEKEAFSGGAVEDMEDRQEGFQDKAVYSVDLKNAAVDADVDSQA